MRFTRYPRPAIVALLALAALTLFVAVRLFVTSAAPDTTPPVLVDFDFNPKSVNVSSGDAFVTVTLHASDDISGILRVDIVFMNPSGTAPRECTGSLISGTPNDGLYSCDVRIPQFSEEGTWVASRIELKDNVANYRWVTRPDLDAAGFPTLLSVTSITDLTAPVLLDFDFNPKSVNVSSGDAFVTVTLHASDDISGILRVDIVFMNPGGTAPRECTGSLISGTPNDGLYSCDVRIPQFSEEGTWVASRIELKDNVANYRWVTRPDLDAAGFPALLSVTSIASPTPTPTPTPTPAPTATPTPTPTPTATPSPTPTATPATPTPAPTLTPSPIAVGGIVELRSSPDPSSADAVPSGGHAVPVEASVAIGLLVMGAAELYVVRQRRG